MKTKSLVTFLSLTLCCTSSAHAETLEWTRQLGGSGRDMSYGVSADGLGNVYISGSTSGSLGGTNAGEGDAFLAKHDESGTLQWIRQLGTSEYDQSRGVSADGLGNVYISGDTGIYGSSTLGEPSAGGRDAFISKYDESGTFQWTHQLGTSGHDFGWGVSADRLGSVYISGSADGRMPGTNATRAGPFVAKFTDFPEPLLGDVNLDVVVNGLDVDPFVDVLLSGAYQAEADMNGDEVINGLDVDPFVGAVIGVGGARVADASASVPESSTLALATLGLLGLVGYGWRRRRHIQK